MLLVQIQSSPVNLNILKATVVKAKKIKASRLKNHGFSKQSFLINYNFKINNNLEKDTSIQVHNRCVNSGRARSVFRNFKMSRIELRRKSFFYKFPGFSKYFW